MALDTPKDKNLPAALIAKFLKEVQEEAEAAIWSQGVRLTRVNGTFMASTMTPQECVIHVRIPTKPVSPKVTLWPEDGEWDCDCGSDESPCEHVAASVIMLKQEKVQSGSTPVEAAKGAGPSSHIQIEYHFKSMQSPRFKELVLARMIDLGNGLEVLDRTILSFKSLRSRKKGMPDVIASQADFQVEQVLKTYRGQALERSRLESLFKAFEPDQKVFLDGKAIELSTSMLLPKYECQDEADGYRLRRVVNDQIDVQFRHGAALCGNKLHLMKSTFLTPEEQELCEGEGSFWPPEREGTLFNKVIPSLEKKIIINVVSLKAPQTLRLEPRIDLLLEKDTLHDGRYCLSVVANLVYGEPEIARLHPKTMELVPQGDNFKDRKKAHGLKRNVDKERELLKKLSRELNLQIARHAEFQDGEAVEFCKKLKDWDFRGRDAYELFSPKGRLLEVQTQVEAMGDASGNVVFSMKFLAPGTADGAAQEIDFKRVLSAWEMNEEYVPLLDGSWAQVPKDWMDQYARRVQSFLEHRDATKLILPKHEQLEMATLCDELGVDLPDSTKELKKLADNFTGIESSLLPADLKAELRSYQRKGVDWLNFLKKSGLGAMLADDMGLGKTLQTLCLFEKRTLVVAPTSVFYNWGAELKKFRPSLKVSYFYGSDRVLDEDADVVLTSYGVLRLDTEKLKALDWKIMVLDEAQVIKNPDSQVAKSAHSMKAEFRVTLTGTPVENHLKDLWSQFHFINPGMLGTLKDFDEGFSRTISRGDADAALKLKRKIKPFILRRLKKEVATELPDKTEVVLNCELTSDERDFYNTLMASTRKEVLANLEDGGNIMQALELILRLRQTCCHRAMIPGAAEAGEILTSSKLDLLVETIEESIDGGHRSLVFSQWTSFLDLIQKSLVEKGIKYSRIDGSTRNRQDIVDRFQSGDSESVMLISLKAGGVGLNLTAADHVFITDPWWNPSVEDQAADRAYRIGQKNPVIVHRLVAKDTLEEKILELQEKKKDLARAVLDEGGAALSLTRADIMDLLS